MQGDTGYWVLSTILFLDGLLVGWITYLLWKNRNRPTEEFLILDLVSKIADSSGDELTFVGPEHEDDHTHKIYCRAFWTGYISAPFTGNTILECLDKAYNAKEAFYHAYAQEMGYLVSPDSLRTKPKLHAEPEDEENHWDYDYDPYDDSGDDDDLDDFDDLDDDDNDDLEGDNLPIWVEEPYDCDTPPLHPKQAPGEDPGYDYTGGFGPER